MKTVRGIVLPDSDTHFGPMIEAGPLFEGKGTYQFAKLQRALEFVKGRYFAIDVGAHVGTFSRVLGREFAHVAAFEPVPEHFICAEINLADVPSVTIHRCALGDVELDSRMDAGGENSGNARLTVDGSIDVQIRRLDDFGYHAVNFIKIDVEGYELAVLKGAQNLISLYGPVIMVEQKPGHAQRYGFGETDAIQMLQDVWNYKVQWNIGGDYCLTPGSA